MEMSEKTLMIRKYDDYSSWVIASKMIEMAYQSIKNSYGKGSPRRLEFKILKERLKKQLDGQFHKNYTEDIVYLNFSPFDKKEVEWFVNNFKNYLEEQGMDNISLYKQLLKDVKAQIKKED